MLEVIMKILALISVGMVGGIYYKMSKTKKINSIKLDFDEIVTQMILKVFNLNRKLIK